MHEELNLVNPFRPCLDGTVGVPLVLCVFRNEAALLTEFLEHYRRLGAIRFVMVDNASNDGGDDMLQREPDVDLWHCAAPFSTPAKQQWINALIGTYGKERWYLVVDADEHVVFDGCDRCPLSDLAMELTEAGLRQTRALMVDMYGPTPLLTEQGRDAPLRQRFPLFDPGGYHIRQLDRILSCQGGPRRRVFGALDPRFCPELTKYPLFWPGAAGRMDNPHFNDPPASPEENLCRLGLLHYKFAGFDSSKISSAIQAKSYWNDSFEYRVYADALSLDPGMTLLSATSRAYEGPGSLLKAGLIAPRSAESCKDEDALLASRIAVVRREERARILRLKQI